MTSKQDNSIIDFVQKTTEAITVMAESTKQNAETLGAIKEMINAQNATAITAFTKMDGKQEGLMIMFKWVIVPLLAALLAMVGVKFVFNL